MAHEPLILVTNPGGASRKYSFIRRGVQIAHVHIEQIRKKIVMHVDTPDASEDVVLQVDNLDNACEAMLQVLVEKDILNDAVTVDAIALRIIAPSAHFLEDKIITNKEISLLQTLRGYAPLQIDTVLQELEQLRTALPRIQVVGVSDSAFHATKPDYTWNYGIRLDDADRYDIKRFGYNGIAVESVIKQIKQTKFAPYSKVVVCHLGNTTSVTAVYNGKSIDTTTGFSPNEGVCMGTGSGAVEFSAGVALAKHNNISPEELIRELHAHSGLLGISGESSDIRELLKLEAAGHHRAELAL
jgi:acetate kinase